jgi:hypothetical protein
MNKKILKIVIPLSFFAFLLGFFAGVFLAIHFTA